ncbi:unknown [Proteobacteria bacterium CAG:495]|nr:unknown [Proteobacteria bacterium CAG:495]
MRTITAVMGEGGALGSEHNGHGCVSAAAERGGGSCQNCRCQSNSLKFLILKFLAQNVAAFDMSGLVGDNAGQFVGAVCGNNCSCVYKQRVAVSNKGIQCRIVNNINVIAVKAYFCCRKQRSGDFSQQQLGFLVGD